MNKTDKPEDIPVPGTDTGRTGIYHLKRFWYKFSNPGKVVNKLNAAEQELDAALLNLLGIGLLPAYRFLYENKPDLKSFEDWVLQHTGNPVSKALIDASRRLIFQEEETSEDSHAAVLSEQDLNFWNENGYVIIKNAVPEADCRAAADAIWSALQMNAGDPDSWYKNNTDLQGIMLPLYRHPAIDKNRQSARIRKAFEQLWGHANLIVTTDKCGFNPPETGTAKYRGIGLHWDVSLLKPIPFGTQGILYLTDTAANQGALTLIPGFHKILEEWLDQLPAGEQPRNFDFSKMAPVGIAANAGDCIIWHHKLPHSSSPNRAATPRLVQYINWYDPLQKQAAEWI